jgi:alpha-glucoside transport system permease protein
VEALETVVSWALLIVACGVVGLAVRAALNKIQIGLADSTAAPGLAGAAVGFGLLAVLLPADSVPFLVGFIIALAGGIATRIAVRALVGNNDALGLGIAVATTVAVLVLAAIVGAPTKLVGFAAVILVAMFTLAMMGTRSLPPIVRQWLPTAGAVVTFIGLFDWFQAKVGGSEFSRMERLLFSPEMERVAATIWAVILAVGASTALFVSANMLFDRTAKNWRQFTAAAGAIIGFLVFGILDGNRILQHLGPRDDVGRELHEAINNGFWTLLLTSIVIGAFIGYVAGYAVGVSRDDRSNPPLVGMAAGATLGLIWGTLFAQRIPVDTATNVLWNALTGAILCGLLGYVVGRTTDDRARAIVATAGGAGIGLLLGGMLFDTFQPRLETVPLIVAPVVVAGVGAGLNALRGRNLVTGAATGALIGWLLGTFGFPTLGGGPEVETLVATGVAGALAGLRYGAKPALDDVGRVNLEQRSRGVIFLMPALGFILTGLVIPLIRTMYLSLFDEGSDNWVGLRNYRTIFTDPKSFDYTDRLGLFDSSLFQLSMVLLAAALLSGLYLAQRSGNTFGGGRRIRLVLGTILILSGILEFVLGRQTVGDVPVAAPDGTLSGGEAGGNWFAIIALVALGVIVLAVPIGKRIGEALPKARVDMSGLPAALLGVSLFLLAFAVFSTLRGTLFNNLWWVFTVTTLSAGFGLAVAVLADRANYENVAKSLIFMPLAISFVGAGIIWRFMYIARDPSKDQTGVMNFIWVELGKISTGGTGRVIGIVVLLAIIAGLGTLINTGYRAKANGVLATAIVFVLPFVWALWRFTFGGGMGGTGFVTDTGVVQDTTVLFLQNSQPFNNLWLMLVLIWIQTGFAMVIFSAAIKAVPTEFIEAAKMDGATDSQIFWRITIPSIAPTIGVVVTTLIVTVMKVFDIVKVMTNGNFDTQVVANEMWQRAFTELNFGLGSALAVVLFLAVVPVMYYNIRTMQREI